jgi:uncharacterized protein YceK
MLRSIKQLYGEKLGASDGEIGQVKDFYFDDEKWAIRYVVVDTGAWLPGRQVLLSPHAFGSLQQVGKDLVVNLTRKQIEGGPSIDSHKPVSRQYEEEYYRYYGWPYYWNGDEVWGMSGFPILEMPPESAAATGRPKPKRADAHLRSTREVTGYHIKSRNGTAGHVCDFMMDGRSWAIIELVVKTGHLLSTKEARIPASEVQRISYDESTVIVNLTKAAVERSCANSVKPGPPAQDQPQEPASAPRPTAAADLNQREMGFVPSPDEIARRAYFTYLNEGSPQGRDVQHWLAAEAELVAERNRTRVHGFHNRK